MTRKRAFGPPAAAIAGVALCLAASGCGSAASTVDPVAQAARATFRAGGAQVALAGSLALPTGTVALSGAGDINFRAHEGQLSITMSGLPASTTAILPGGTLQLNELLDSSSVYLESPLFAGQLPGGARWVKLDLPRLGQLLGLDPTSLTSGGWDPGRYLQYLTAEGASFRVVGHEDVRGVAATHYAGSVNLLKAAESQPGANLARVRAAIEQLSAKIGLASVPLEVWVDGHGLVRKLGVSLASTVAGQTLRTSFTIEYFRFGATPTVNPPSGSEVFDATSRVLQGLPGG